MKPQKRFWLGLLCYMQFVSVMVAQSKHDLQQMAKKQAQQIQNYTELSASAQQKLVGEISRWLWRMKQLQMADSRELLPSDYLNLPAGLIYLASKKNEQHMVAQSGISFVPDLDLFYGVYYKYYSFLIRYGAKTPIPEVVFAIMNQETGFLWIKGDYGKSIGPCQLHKATAQWLLLSDQYETYARLFYFDKRGNHHFYSQESMIEFVYEFLIGVKNYDVGQEAAAIAAYNGCEIDAPYTLSVQVQTMKYLAFQTALCLQQSDSTLSYASLRAAVERKLLRHLSLRGLDLIGYDRLSSDAAEFVLTQRGSIWANQSASNCELQQITVGQNRGFVQSPKPEKGRPYILKDPQNFMFGYFRENLDTSVFYHNWVVSQEIGLEPSFENVEQDTNFIYLYYDKLKNGVLQRHYIRNVNQYKQVAKTETVQCNKLQGKIYIIPGIPIYFPSHNSRRNQLSFFVKPSQIDPAVRQMQRSGYF